ncbi:MAG TPA: hypothetical protein VN328_13145 [Thermodesulfovibrionales bacterium]|nr:hypothetical protein [Thermodesulfovibrionales bacterium]
MKLKTILTLAISACLIIGLGVAAYGALATSTTGPTGITLQSPNGTNTGIIITPSTNVGLAISSGGPSYALGACHSSGDKQFGVAAGAVGFYFQGVAQGSCTASTMASALSASDATSFNGWYSL